jgi:hypothetical protein
VGIAATSVSPTIVLESRSIVAAMHALVVSGTINYTLQETLENPFVTNTDTLSWLSMSSAYSAKTATVTGQGVVGATAVRVLTNTVTNGATYTLMTSHPTQQTG